MSLWADLAQLGGSPAQCVLFWNCGPLGRNVHDGVPCGEQVVLPASRSTGGLSSSAFWFSHVAGVSHSLAAGFQEEESKSCLFS